MHVQDLVTTPASTPWIRDTDQTAEPGSRIQFLLPGTPLAFLVRMVRPNVHGDIRSSSQSVVAQPGIVSLWLVALISVTTIAFLASAAVFIAPGVATLWERTWVPTTTAHSASLRQTAPSITADTALTDTERSMLLSYVDTFRPEDALIEVRPGVQAKRSNVHGISLEDRTVYYDIAGHQSFGPLASGKVRESQVQVLWRLDDGPFRVLFYSLK